MSWRYLYVCAMILQHRYNYGIDYHKNIVLHVGLSNFNSSVNYQLFALYIAVPCKMWELTIMTVTIALVINQQQQLTTTIGNMLNYYLHSDSVLWFLIKWMDHTHIIHTTNKTIYITLYTYYYTMRTWYICYHHIADVSATTYHQNHHS